MPQWGPRDVFPLWSLWCKHGDASLAEHVQLWVKPCQSHRQSLWWKTSYPAGFLCHPGINAALFSFQPPVFTDSTGIKSRSTYGSLSPFLCWCHLEALSLRLGMSSLPPVWALLCLGWRALWRGWARVYVGRVFFQNTINLFRKRQWMSDVCCSIIIKKNILGCRWSDAQTEKLNGITLMSAVSLAEKVSLLLKWWLRISVGSLASVFYRVSILQS